MNNYAQHENAKRYFKLRFQKAFPKARIFDRHVGMFYRKNGTPIKINRKGMADLWAIIPGRLGLIHLEFEIKTGSARLTKEQRAWRDQIEKMGGIYIVVSQAERAIRTLQAKLEGKLGLSENNS